MRESAPEIGSDTIFVEHQMHAFQEMVYGHNMTSVFLIRSHGELVDCGVNYPLSPINFR